MTEKCTATCRDGSPCGAYPVEGSDKCRMHGGSSTGPKTDGGKETVSSNAITHGATADPHNLYGTLEEEDKKWVDALTNSYIEESTYSHDSPQAERIETTVIMVWQERSGRAQLIKEGLEREQVVGVTEHGAVKATDSHHLNSVVSSLNSDIRMNLKDLGLIDDPDSKQAEATRSIAEILSED